MLKSYSKFKKEWMEPHNIFPQLKQIYLYNEDNEFLHGSRGDSG